MENIWAFDWDKAGFKPNSTQQLTLLFLESFVDSIFKLLSGSGTTYEELL